MFSRVSALVPAERGSILVAEASERRLRRYDSSGVFQQAIGNPGRGPGEFARLSQVGVFSDTVWTTDISLRRSSLFRMDGALITTLPWAVGEAGSGDYGNAMLGLFADGTAWGESNLGAQSLAGPELPRSLFRLDRESRRLKVLAVVPTAHSVFFLMDGPTINFGTQPFADSPLVIGSSASSRVYVVERASSASRQRGTFHVVAISAGGDTVWKRGYDYQPRPLERTVSDSLVRKVHLGVRRSGATVDDVRRVLYLPQNRPPISAGFATAEGALWLRREEGRSHVEYWILALDGTLRGTVSVPSGVVLMASREDLVWGAESDVDGVQSIVRFRIRR